jgi:hypothetical protein
MRRKDEAMGRAFIAKITASNYRMVSTALNALGVQLEPGGERFPNLWRSTLK